MEEELLVPLLLNGDLFVYETVENRVQLCYGIECEEFNQTNNRNVLALTNSFPNASPMESSSSITNGYLRGLLQMLWLRRRLTQRTKRLLKTESS